MEATKEKIIEEANEVIATLDTPLQQAIYIAAKMVQADKEAKSKEV